MGETYAPVAKLTSIRILLAVMAHFDLEIHQMAVLTAILEGELDKKVFPDICNGIDEVYKCRLFLQPTKVFLWTIILMFQGLSDCSSNR